MRDALDAMARLLTPKRFPLDCRGNGLHPASPLVDEALLLEILAYPPSLTPVILRMLGELGGVLVARRLVALLPTLSDRCRDEARLALAMIGGKDAVIALRAEGKKFVAIIAAKDNESAAHGGPIQFEMDGSMHTFGATCCRPLNSGFATCPECQSRMHFQPVRGGYYHECEVCHTIT